jgi:TGF-beta receptor, other
LCEEKLISEYFVSFPTDNVDSEINQTFLVSEIIGDKNEHLTFADTNAQNRGWEKIDIMTWFDVWMEKKQFDHLIQIKCDTCTSGFLPISTQPDTKAFIVIDTISQKGVSRQRRSMDCGPGSSECCRDVLYIDFEEIGWNDWIIFPKGYHAYFCRGTCSRISSIQKAGSDHAMAVQVSYTSYAKIIFY